jgi:hypothetical protein
VPDFEHDGIWGEPLMTNTRSSQQPSKKVREARAKKSTAGKPAGNSPDACELLLAELQARRERIQQLLNLVHIEAYRLEPVRKSLPPNHQCQPSRRRRGA